MLLAEVAREFRFRPEFVKRYFPVVTIGGRRRYERRAVTEFVAAHSHAPHLRAARPLALQETPGATLARLRAEGLTTG